MKNLLMMISVALLVLGVVYVVKHRKTEPVYAPAFNNGLPVDSQPAGPLDGEYKLVNAICPSKKEVSIPESRASRIKVRGMSAVLFRKAGHCEISQNLDVIGGVDSQSFQFKQDRVECAPDCPCFATITGTVLIDLDLKKKEIKLTEAIRSEKEICDGKLPVVFKFAASAP